MRPHATTFRLLSLALVLRVCTGWCQPSNSVHYTLLSPSYFIDDCLLCNRPVIQEPLRGTFDLVLEQNIPPYTRYSVRNLDFVSSPGGALEKHVTGAGAYVRFEEFAISQDMTVAAQVETAFTNETAFFTNGTPLVQKPFPLIELTLTQTNGNFAHTYTMHLLAAPLQEIWFSTLKSFTATNLASPTNLVSPGDLVSSTGHVIRRNSDLVGQLGIMPVVSDLGLDAVDFRAAGEVLFSLPVDVFSETLGLIQNGDLLSSQGLIVRRNQDLLSAFHPASTNDAGLDGVQIMPDGEILFSIQSNVAIDGKLTLSRGDILSDQGQIYLTHEALLANFHPSQTNYDFGLSAFRILPSGEVWFAVEEGFTDNLLGPITSGDLLSNLGYKVFSNQDLAAALGPSDPTLNYSLDALWVVTDTLPAKPPPRISRQAVSGGMLHLEWGGPGSAFQVNSAPSPTGPWLPASQITPSLSWDAPVDTSAQPAMFYRVRQW